MQAFVYLMLAEIGKDRSIQKFPGMKCLKTVNPAAQM